MRNKKRNLVIDQTYQDPEDPEFSLLVQEKQKTLKAIESLNYRLTPTDLAAESGLSINQASYWLNKVAGECKGKLEVRNDGSIFYSFEKDFKNAYLQRGIRKVLLIIGAISFQFLYWVIRVSFGVALALSVLLVVLLIIAAVVALMGDNGGGDGGGGGGDLGGFFDPSFLFDIFRWDYSASTYYPSTSYQTGSYPYQSDSAPKGNFFLECFSFMFGDGKPNPNLQQERWQQIAHVIADNGGVVSSEQLAPYLDGDQSDSGMILSALAQFNGKPEVTKSGFIVYVFPDFIDPQTTPTLPEIQKEDFLLEEHWKFSAYPAEKWIGILLLAIFNFAGSWWLFKHIATIALLHYVSGLIDVLLAYSIIFLAIPAIRWLVLCVLNMRVDERNERRKKAMSQVIQPQGEILKELNEAKEIRAEEISKLAASDAARIVYRTDKDQLEQNFDTVEKISLKQEEY
ncbi:MAG: hypothetical protein K2X27_18495 [Candidatus Obscuribacterales bacterium]|nr:hypothetical protein [Candidatus Obscuribacterales bacterium]